MRMAGRSTSVFIQKESPYVTVHNPTYPFAARSGLTKYASSKTSEWASIWVGILRSARAAEEVRVPNKMGGHNRGAEAEVTETAVSGETARDRVTTAEVRIMLIVAMSVEADIRTEVI